MAIMKSGAFKEDARAVWRLGAPGTPLHLQRVVRWSEPALDVQTGDSDVGVKRLGRCLF
jgi:hypothetical protein